MEHFEAHGFAVNRGYESQTGMRLEQWDASALRLGDAVAALKSFDARQAAKCGPQDSQLPLFG
jgi:hypothetical protein